MSAEIYDVPTLELTFLGLSILQSANVFPQILRLYDPNTVVRLLGRPLTPTPKLSTSKRMGTTHAKLAQLSQRQIKRRK